MSAADLAARIAAGEVSAVEVAQAHIDRISAVDDRVHAFLHVDVEGALAQARRGDAGGGGGPPPRGPPPRPAGPVPPPKPPPAGARGPPARAPPHAAPP